jgi:thiamine-phosphate pyrophosphorylase
LARLSKVLIYRILDANLNRATEGMRVSEEVARFILNDRQLTAQFRNIRHQIFKVFGKFAREELIKKRDSQQDVARNFLGEELNRDNYQDIFFANMQRVKESIRVLEEFYKLIDKKASIKLKKIRYHVYEVEKKAALGLSALSDIRQRLLFSR